MRTQSMLLVALAAVPAALAHTSFTDFFVDGVPQGDGVAMRMSPHIDSAGSPIASLDSTDMACNVEGTKGVSRVQPVQDGALLTFEIRSWADDPSKPPLDRGHYGPCAVYLKKVDSAVDDTAAGDGWFKLFDHGYNSNTKRWCSDEIIDNKGLLSVHLPKGLEGGYYLARPEILALHQANSGNPQFYTGCAQIFLKSTGNLVPESTVSIPGYVKYGQPATSFDIYNTDASTYTLPGPPIAKLTARGAQSASDSQTTQSEGVKPAGCLVENANWCGFEVPSYTTETGCWASAEKCWSQSETCYSTAGPVGHAGCDLWAKKCTGIQDECNGGNFNGPPNKDKVLTPTKNPINVGQIMATVGGGSAQATATAAAETTSAEPAAAETTAAEQEEEQSTAAGQEYEQSTAADAETTAPAEYKETPAQAKPTSTPAQTTAPAAAPKPSNKYNGYKEDKPKPTSKTTNNGAYKEDQPTHTFVVKASSANAPAPTQAPPACPKHWKCVTVTEVEVVTKTVYVTAYEDDGGYKKRSGGAVHRKRWAHHA